MNSGGACGLPVIRSMFSWSGLAGLLLCPFALCGPPRAHNESSKRKESPRFLTFAVTANGSDPVRRLAGYVGTLGRLLIKANSTDESGCLLANPPSQQDQSPIRQSSHSPVPHRSRKLYLRMPLLPLFIIRFNRARSSCPRRDRQPSLFM